MLQVPPVFPGHANLQGWPADATFDTCAPKCADLEEKLRGLPRGKFTSLTISLCYLDAAGADATHGTFDGAGWVSQSEKDLALKNNSVWRISWFPDAPVGHCEVLASSLSACLGAILE